MPKHLITTSPRPAHETKQESNLRYPFLSNAFQLNQLDNGQSNGTGLWLGAQCLSLYLWDINPTLIRSTRARRKQNSSHGDVEPHRSPRAIELGSGVGLGALALASMGWDVVATDTAYIVNSVLRSNVTSNAGGMPTQAIQARELDWRVPPERWTWTHPSHIASMFPADDVVPSNASSIVDMSSKVEHDAATPSPSTISPPFDLIITSDTIFSVDLSPHLIRTIHHLCQLSAVAVNDEDKLRYPIVYLALENRDPITTNRALDEARDVWGFTLTRVLQSKVGSAMKRGGVDWTPEEWEGVEIWRLTL
ncbi:hypothetical protein FRB95_011418 [Tulasnella sp. JGI-2019a]|nr:hypothetical protein FRB93_012042 [Tulasnella sp. JGI-2019a]KAG9035398.1 hypothetical protein FRB95_011418 [Tulasnella sp. JGI-2019a]